jgi:signal transduction histidine kinase
MELQKDQPDPEAFHVATSQLERIERTVKQFLELGRPLAPPKTMINLQSVLAEVVRLHAPKARHLGIRLIFQDEAKPVMIKGDAPELVHAFGNIVTNALEAAGPAGEVTIRGFFENAGSWLLEVSDNGPGLPPGLELFTPFASAKPGGIGLGLVVVKEILQAHQGTITLTRQNTLTVATVTFPM